MRLSWLTEPGLVLVVLKVKTYKMCWQCRRRRGWEGGRGGEEQGEEVLIIFLSPASLLWAGVAIHVFQPPPPPYPSKKKKKKTNSIAITNQFYCVVCETKYSHNAMFSQVLFVLYCQDYRHSSATAYCCIVQIMVLSAECKMDFS